MHTVWYSFRSHRNKKANQMNQAIQTPPQSQPGAKLHQFETTPFTTMVGRLFKQIPEMPYGSLMHGVAALLGEAVEWAQTTDR